MQQAMPFRTRARRQLAAAPRTHPAKDHAPSASKVLALSTWSAQQGSGPEPTSPHRSIHRQMQEPEPNRVLLLAALAGHKVLSECRDGAGLLCSTRVDTSRDTWAGRSKALEYLLAPKKGHRRVLPPNSRLQGSEESIKDGSRMETGHATSLGAEGRQGWGTPAGQPRSQGAGTSLDGSAWRETQQCKLLPQQRDGPAPFPAHRTLPLLIKSVRLAEPGENKLL